MVHALFVASLKFCKPIGLLEVASYWVVSFFFNTPSITCANFVVFGHSIIDQILGVPDVCEYLITIASEKNQPEIPRSFMDRFVFICGFLVSLNVLSEYIRQK